MDSRLYALCYLHDWDPKREDGSQPIYPQIHALYHSWKEAEAVRNDMGASKDKYWVVSCRFESAERLAKVKQPSGENAILIERLRNAAPAAVSEYDTALMQMAARALTKADERIEALERQVAQLNGDAVYWNDMSALAEERATHLDIDLSRAIERVRELRVAATYNREQAEAAERELEKAREALRPFVKYTHEKYFEGDGVYVLKKANPVVVGGGWYGAEDFRRARAVLEPKK